MLTDVGANLVFALVTRHSVPTNTGKDLPIEPLEQVCVMFLHFVREGEAPAEPLTANGSPGGSPSHTLTKTSKEFIKLFSGGVYGIYM